MREKNGQFSKGNGGRVKGTKNKSNLEVRQRLHNLTEMLEEQIISELEKIDIKDKVKLYVSLLPYISNQKPPRDGTEENAIGSVTYPIDSHVFMD